jgi:hypothetical protein
MPSRLTVRSQSFSVILLGKLGIQPIVTSIFVMAQSHMTQGASRYDALIATLVGVLALCVSGYTAYVQRQQVRAAVWPILQYDTSNGPYIKLNLDNKGVGPAIIKHVVVKVDDQPVRNWSEALNKFAAPGRHSFSQSTISGRVLAANESMEVFVPHDDEGNNITEKSGPLGAQLNRDRNRISVEICYCSTLGDCWILRSGPNGNSTTETRTCPKPSDTSFEQ